MTAPPVTVGEVTRAAALLLDDIELVRAYCALVPTEEKKLGRVAEELSTWLRRNRTRNWGWHPFPKLVADFLEQVECEMINEAPDRVGIQFADGSRGTLATNSSVAACHGRVVRMLGAHLRAIADAETKRRELDDAT